LNTQISQKRSLSIFNNLKLICKETIQDDPIIEDWLACSIANKINCEYYNENINTNERVKSALIRKYFDTKVTEFINNNEKPIIIMLGCGFDTRHNRINKKGKQSIFYGIDTPEVISVRETVIPTTENNKNIQESLLSENWIKSVTNRHKDGNFMIILEKLLIHFEKDEINVLFKNISENFKSCDLHFDTETNYIYTKHISIIEKFQNKFNLLKLPDNFKYKSSILLTETPEWKHIYIKKNMLSKALNLFNLPKHRFSHCTLK
jgi:O-methyltransferase involved in polyketide biosynthesis